MSRLAVAVMLVLAVTGCEEEPPMDLLEAPTTTPATRPAMSMALVTTAPATTQAASRPADPLATPVSAVDEMFKLMKENKHMEVRMLLIDPPEPEVLKAAVLQNHDELTHGGSWQVLETREKDPAAIVIYKTRFANGVEDISPIYLVKRYDRWKIILGNFSAKKFSDREGADLLTMIEWGQKRVKQLRLAAATQPASSQPTN
jgi:hypothetical protein